MMTHFQKKFGERCGRRIYSKEIGQLKWKIIHNKMLCCFDTLHGPRTWFRLVLSQHKSAYLLYDFDQEYIITVYDQDMFEELIQNER